MAIQIKNNATGTLSTAISASDLGIALTTGDGDEFPALSGSDYFYATLVATDGTKEIVKVTALSGDSMTIVRAQEDTTAHAFAAGTSIQLRVTKQNLVDAVAEFTQAFLDTLNTFTVAQTFDAIVNIFGGNKLRFYNSSDANPHGIRNNANVLTFDYDGTDYLTVSTGGVFNFSAAPTIASAVIYRAGGTDVPLTDGGTGASTAAGARTNLELEIGVDVQAYSALLDDFIGQPIAADKLIYSDSGSSFAVADLPSFGRTLIANTTAADARTDLGLSSLATQSASSVALTGGTIVGVTELQGRIKISPETSGTLTALSANAIVFMTGDVEIDPAVFSPGDIILLYSGSSTRLVDEGSGMTLRLASTTSTGTRSMAIRSFCPLLFITASEAVISGSGAS